ncbi:hypothetical protein O988_06381 [Pseudogymnoascus sp. VKM F-3808]|nr:hypothetical protein O988_06381 [Pseudogymnoascus sp. VKM F-3808]
MQVAVYFVILSLSGIVQYGYAADSGIMGFGLSLYQDLCCQTCHDSLSALYLNCTTFPTHEGMDMSMDMDMDMEMAMMPMTSDECYAANTPWLQTMAFCIQQNCNADGYSADKQAKCFSTQAVAGASEPTFQDSLPATAPTLQLSEDAMWLNSTSLVNKNTYDSIHGTLKEFTRQEYMHTRYSIILLLVVLGICIGGGILAQTTSAFLGFQTKLHASALWTKLQQHIFLPALVGSRRLEPLPGNVGYLPSRTLSIFIAIFIILNVILSCVSYRTSQPNTWFKSGEFELCEYVGNRTGTLSLVNMCISILFASRNNLLIAFTGWNQTAFLTLHRWVAGMAALQAVVHSIAYTLAYFEPGYGGAAEYAVEAAMPFYWWGIIATIALCLAAGFAILPIRIRYYEFFLVTHIVFVIIALVGCWYHLIPHFGFVFGYQTWLYIAFAFWAADRFARLVRVAYYNRLSGSTALIETIPGCDIMQVTVFPRAAWDFGPGQHSFLYLAGLGKFWESHPFSIAGWKGQLPTTTTSASAPPSPPSPFSGSAVKDEEAKDSGVVSLGSQPNSTTTLPDTQTQGKAYIRFLIRAHSGMTSTLQRRLLSSPSRSSLEASVYTEGPYAGHRATLHPLFIADTVLCIVGGIGITNILGFVQEYSNANLRASARSGKSQRIMKKARRFILAWSAREMTLIEHVKEAFLLPKDEVDGIEYSFWCTRSSGVAEPKIDTVHEEIQKDEGVAQSSPTDITAGRMDIRSVMRAHVETGQQTTVMAVKSDMLPPLVSKKSSWESTPTIFQQGDPERGQVEGSPSSYADGANENNKNDENDGANPLPSSFSKSETNGDIPAETDPKLIVWWDGPEDPENPMNWSSTWKWVNICVISVISFLVPLVSSMMAPGVQLVMEDFNTTSPTFATFVVSIFVLGFACGPLLLAPLSELYGRVIIYNTTNVLFLGFTIICAVSQNTSMLLAFRFLSGFAGVATITIGSGTIADIMPREKRGKAVSIWSVGPILGPMIGPIIGGNVAEAAGWRWMFWAISIAIGVVTIVTFLVLKETYPVVLLERKASKLRKATGNPNHRSKLASDLTPKKLFKHSIIRPLKMLICCPIVTVMCTYVAILYGILYLLFATYSFVFREVYDFTTASTGLVFLAGGMGTLMGLFYVGYFSDRTLVRRAAAGKTITPEDRLPFIITIPGSLTFPIGLFIYGWTAQEHVHWIVPQIGTAITGFGSILIFVGIQTYLVDAFEVYAASVIGANAVLRGTAGALIPLGGLRIAGVCTDAMGVWNVWGQDSGLERE